MQFWFNSGVYSAIRLQIFNTISCSTTFTFLPQLVLHMGMFSLLFAVHSVTSEVMFYSYFPNTHLSGLPSVPQAHHHIFQNSLKEKYTSVYVADLCVADTLKCYHICSYLHSTFHTCVISNDKNVICPGMR